jgi:hypothetical protein
MRPAVQVLHFIPILALCCGLAPDLFGASAFDVLQTQREEHLYYADDALPAAVKALIKDPATVADAVAYYRQAKDDLVRFNILIILDKRMTTPGLLADADRAPAIAHFAAALKDPNPWLRTEAVSALGDAGDRANLQKIARCLNDPCPTVVHFANGGILSITGKRAPLTPAQANQDLKATMAELKGWDAMNALADAELKASLTQNHGDATAALPVQTNGSSAAPTAPAKP